MAGQECSHSAADTQLPWAQPTTPLRSTVFPNENLETSSLLLSSSAKGDFFLFVGILNFHQKSLPIYLLWTVLLSSSQFLQQWRWAGFCSNCTAGEAALLKPCWKMRNFFFLFLPCSGDVLGNPLSYVNFYPAVKYAIILTLISYGCYQFYYFL